MIDPPQRWMLMFLGGSQRSDSKWETDWMDTCQGIPNSTASLPPANHSQPCRSFFYFVTKKSTQILPAILNIFSSRPSFWKDSPKTFWLSNEVSFIVILTLSLVFCLDTLLFPKCVILLYNSVSETKGKQTLFYMKTINEFSYEGRWRLLPELVWVEYSICILSLPLQTLSWFFPDQFLSRLTL